MRRRDDVDTRMSPTPTWHVFVLVTTIMVLLFATALTASNALRSRRTAAVAHQPPSITYQQPPSVAQEPRTIVLAQVPSTTALPAAESSATQPPAAELSTTQPPAAETSVAQPPAATAPPVLATARPANDVAAKRTQTPKRSMFTTAAKPSATAAADNERGALLVKYQRVRHNLLLAKRDLGPAAVAHVSDRLQWMKLDLALATTTSRRLMGNTLDQLQGQIDAARAARR